MCVFVFPVKHSFGGKKPPKYLITHLQLYK